MSALAVVGLGANLGAPATQIAAALAALRRDCACGPLRVSPLYRSAPMGGMAQPDYANAIACFPTDLSALALLDTLQALEAAAGRQRAGERWAARPLDLDLLDLGGQSLRHPRLCLPHPGIAERDFVLLPWLTLDPAARLSDGRRIRALWQARGSTVLPLWAPRRQSANADQGATQGADQGADPGSGPDPAAAGHSRMMSAP